MLNYFKFGPVDREEMSFKRKVYRQRTHTELNAIINKLKINCGQNSSYHVAVFVIPYIIEPHF